MKKVLLFFLLLTGSPAFPLLFSQSQFAVDEFMGINLRREDPVEWLNCVGGVAREFHDWSVDQSNRRNFLKCDCEDGVPSGPAPWCYDPSVYPNQRFKFNPSE